MAAPERRSATPEEETRVMTLYGQHMTRSSSIFALGIIAIVPFGIASLAVTTRYLDPADFGRLAILFAIASVLTMMCGAGFLQGTLLLTYGIADEEDDAVEVEEEEEEARPEQRSEERARILGSGFLIVLVTSTALCAVAGVVGVLVAEAAFGSEWSIPVLWMVASAWSGGIWRFSHQVPRMERRPGRWAALMWIRPALVVAATIAALAAGYGINGVLVATATGTVLATLLALFISRHCFRFAPKREDIGKIWRKGRKWVPLIFAVAVQQNVAVLMLSAFAPAASVGLFQAANRIAQIPMYFGQGFITAWPPLERSPISLAAKERKGKRPYAASVFTLFAFVVIGLLLATSIASGALIHIAAPEYESAAGLIPVIAVMYAGHVVFRGVFRAVAFPKRRWWYVALLFFWLLPFLGSAALLVQWKPTYGIAIAQIIASVVVICIFVARERATAPEPTPFQWRRLAVALLIAGLCVGAVLAVPTGTSLRFGLTIAALVAFPLLLLATGVLSRQQVGVVRSIFGSLMPKLMTRRQARRRLAAVPESEREAVVLLACERAEPEAAAGSLGVSPSILQARLVRGLRDFAGGGRATPMDHEIAQYLLNDGTTIERDAWASYLRGKGVDSLELHVLDEAIRRVSSAGVSNGRNGRRKGREALLPSST